MKLGPETRVLLTGASRGIGEALARGFAERGCRLGLVARSEGELSALVVIVSSGASQGSRGVDYPPILRLLRIAHGISPRAGDLVLRGPSAAPRP